MLVIHRYSSPEEAKRLRSLWESAGAKMAPSIEEAIELEKSGHLAFIDETSGSVDCMPEEERGEIFDFEKVDEWPDTYTLGYVEPVLDHLCSAGKAWFELRHETLRNRISVISAYEDGPYWAREVKIGFMHQIAPKILQKHEPFEEDGCRESARVSAIKRILNMEHVYQTNIENRITIASRYADLEQLMGFNIEPPREPTVWTPGDSWPGQERR